MPFDLNNPWLVATIASTFGAVLGGIIVYYLTHSREQKQAKSALEGRIDDAYELLEKGQSKEALAIYNDILKKLSPKDDPDVYGHVKNGMGICYHKLALINDTEENLTKAIGACEAALKNYTVKKYPVDYAMTQNNLGNAYGRPSQTSITVIALAG